LPYKSNENCLNDLTVEVSNKKKKEHKKINNEKQNNRQTLENMCKGWRNKTTGKL